MTTTMRSNTLRLLPTKAQEATLHVVGDRVAALWNAANYLCRQRFLKGEGVPRYTSLCVEMIGHDAYKALPSDVAQEVLKKLAEAWQSYFALRTRWTQGALPQKPGLPQYRKRRDGSRPHDLIPVKCPRSYRVDATSVAVALPADLRAGGRLTLSHRGRRRYPGTAGRAELRWDHGRGRWYFHYSVRVERAPRTGRLRTNAAAIDLGVRVLVSLSVADSPTAIHFLGREVLKDWDYWGREIATHMAELAHRPKGQRSSKRLRRLHHQRQTRWEHAWEALAARVAAACRSHGVGTVYLGWPKHIRRDTSHSARWNGRIHGFWGFDRASRILEKHLERAGIAVARVGERGTSSECPRCDSPAVVRHPRHRLTCRVCGLRIHSDQAGSRNLLKIHIPSVTWAGAEAVPRPETHRWNRHRWVDVENPFGGPKDLAA